MELTKENWSGFKSNLAASLTVYFNDVHSYLSGGSKLSMPIIQSDIYSLVKKNFKIFFGDKNINEKEIKKSIEEIFKGKDMSKDSLSGIEIDILQNIDYFKIVKVLENPRLGNYPQ